MRVVVVGAGIVGASAAFHLARAGVETVVVDRAHPGKATLAGAGIVCPWTTSATDPDFVALYCAGAGATARLVERLSELGETDTGYARVGAIELATDDAELEPIERLVRERSTPESDAGEVRRLAGGECRDRFPPLRDDHAGLWIGGAARLDPRRLTAALLRAFRVELRQGLVDLVVDGGRAHGVALGEERLDAGTRVGLRPLARSGGTDPRSGSPPRRALRGHRHGRRWAHDRSPHRPAPSTGVSIHALSIHRGDHPRADVPRS